MILAAFTALVLGVVQVLIDIALFPTIFASKLSKAIVLIFLKLLVYGAFFAVVYFFFKAFIQAIAIGFGIGFFPFLFVYSAIKIKNDKGGT